MRVSQPQVSGYQRRLAPERQVKVPDSFLRAPGGDLQLAQPHPCQRIHAVAAEGFRVGVLGFFDLVNGLQRLAQRYPCGDHLRRSGHGSLGHFDGCF